MKIVTYTNKEGADLGLLLNDKIYSLKAIASTMNAFLQMGDTAMENAKSIENSIKNGSSNLEGISLTEAKLLAPIPCPPSCRDAYAFRKHVEAGRKNRGLEMIPEYDIPVFLFSIRNSSPDNCSRVYWGYYFHEG